MIIGYNIDTDVIVGKLTEDEIDRALYEREEDIIDYFIDKELISYKKQIKMNVIQHLRTYRN
jgi:predicted transcriptional regulator